MVLYKPSENIETIIKNKSSEKYIENTNNKITN